MFFVLSASVQHPIYLHCLYNLTLHYPPHLFSGMKGVHGFWLTALKNVELLASMIQEYDVPILEKISNIRVDFSAEPMVRSQLLLHKKCDIFLCCHIYIRSGMLFGS